AGRKDALGKWWWRIAADRRLGSAASTAHGNYGHRRSHDGAAERDAQRACFGQSADISASAVVEQRSAAQHAGAPGECDVLSRHVVQWTRAGATEYAGNSGCSAVRGPVA